ncbi:hypothetical protein [Bartonella sp. DGB2]|uniref:hypothetical protein n=1 Tax=Bartonella sp. DGB2 TaxID=3388426 RepID=UPI00398FFF7C
MSTRLFGTNVDALRLPTIPLQPAGVPNRPTIQPLRREVGGRERQFFQALSTLNHNLNAYIDRYEDERQNPYSEENMKALAKLQSMSPQELKAASLENSTSGIWVREQLNNRLLADNALNEFRKSFAPLESQSFDPKQGGIEATYDTMAKHFADGLPNSMAQNMFYSQLHEHRTRTILEYNQRKNEYAKGQVLSVIHDRIGQDVQDARKQNLSPIGIAQLMVENTSKYTYSYHMTSPERDSLLLNQVQDLLKEGHIAEAKAVLDHPLTDDEGKLSVPLGQNVQYEHYTGPLYGAIHAKEALDTHQKAEQEAFNKTLTYLQQGGDENRIEPVSIPNEKGTGFDNRSPQYLRDGAIKSFEDGVEAKTKERLAAGVSLEDAQKEAFITRWDFYSHTGLLSKDWQGQFSGLLTKVNAAKNDASEEAFAPLIQKFELARDIGSLDESYLRRLAPNDATFNFLKGYIINRTNSDLTPKEAIMAASDWENKSEAERRDLRVKPEESAKLVQDIANGRGVKSSSTGLDTTSRLNYAIINKLVQSNVEHGGSYGAIKEKVTAQINHLPVYNGVLIANSQSVPREYFKVLDRVVEASVQEATKERRVNAEGKPQVSLDRLYVAGDENQGFYVHDMDTGAQINVTPITKSDLRDAFQKASYEEDLKAAKVWQRQEALKDLDFMDRMGLAYNAMYTPVELQDKLAGNLVKNPKSDKDLVKEYREEPLKRAQEAKVIADKAKKVDDLQKQYMVEGRLPSYLATQQHKAQHERTRLKLQEAIKELNKVQK